MKSIVPFLIIGFLIGVGTTLVVVKKRIITPPPSTAIDSITTALWDRMDRRLIERDSLIFLSLDTLKRLQGTQASYTTNINNYNTKFDEIKANPDSSLFVSIARVGTRDRIFSRHPETD